MARSNAKERPWAGVSAHPAKLGRAVHFGRSEAGASVALKQLPSGFGESLHEQRVLTTPGVTKGFEHANKVIEDWKQSL